MGRVPLSQLPLNEEDWPAFAKGLSDALSLEEVALPLGGETVKRRKISDPPTIVIFALRTLPPNLDDWPALMVVSQDFAVKLRDARSDSASSAGDFRWVVFVDREMDSIRSASACLTDPGNSLDPEGLLKDLFPGLASPNDKLFPTVQGDLMEALRDPSRSAKLNEHLERWAGGTQPPASQLLAEALDWFADSELKDLLLTQSSDAIDRRIQENRSLSQKANDLRSRNAASTEWAESFAELTDAQRRALQQNGPSAVEFREASARPARDKFEEFRSRTSNSVLTRNDGKHALHVLVSRGQEFRVSLVYTGTIGSTPIRAWVDEAEVAPAELPRWTHVTGRELTLSIPANTSEVPRYVALNTYFQKATSRGEPTELVRVLQLPSSTPVVMISDFRIGEPGEGCLVLDTSQGLIVETPLRRATLRNPAIDAFDPGRTHDLPANIRVGPQDLSLWRFQAETGEFVLPIRCIGPEEEEVDAEFHGVLLLPSVDAGAGRPAFWKREPEGRGIQDALGTRRLPLSSDCNRDLALEEQIAEGGWLSPIGDVQGSVLRDGAVPAVIRAHEGVQKIQRAYAEIFRWLKANQTLPTLVGPEAPDYWLLVDQLLESIREYIQGTWDGPEKMEWVAQLGTVRNAAGFIERTGPLWPPSLWMGAQLSKGLREGSIAPEDLPPDAFSPANIVPLNLWTARSPQFGMPRPCGLWSWLDWKPLDRSFDRIYLDLGRIFKKRMSQFLASFPNLSTAEIPSPLKVRFVRILPDAQLVAEAEAFISEALSEGRWTPEHQIEFEFMLESPRQETLLDERLDPSVENIDAVHGFDLLHRCLRVRKVPIEFLFQPPPDWDRYAHVTFVGGQTTYQTGPRPAAELMPSCAVNGFVPVQVVDLAPGTRRHPTPRGPGLGTATDESSKFPALWNHAIVSASGQRPWDVRDPRFAPFAVPISEARNSSADFGAHSLWLIYLEPGVGLLPLTGEWNQETQGPRRVLVHFTTVGRIGTPGYSDITVTEKVDHLYQALEVVCRTYGFDDAADVIPLMNSLNGEWILRLVQGVVHEVQGQALLATVKTGHYLLERLRNTVPEFEWIVAGWEDFHFVTGGTGRTQQDAGIVSSGGGSDDILLVGISRTEPRKLRLALGESKFGQAPLNSGEVQLRDTHQELMRLYKASGSLGAIDRARLGHYVLLAAERMAAHRLLNDGIQTWLHENQRQLLMGDFEIDEAAHANLPTVGFLVHVDPEAFRVEERVSGGVLRVRLPGGRPRAAAVPVEPGMAPAPSPMPRSPHPAPSPLPAGKAEPASPPMPVALATPAITTRPQAPPIVPPGAAPEVLVPGKEASHTPGSTQEDKFEPSSLADWMRTVLAKIPVVEVPPPHPPSDQIFTIDRILSDYGIRVDPPEREDVVVGPQTTVVHLRMGPGVTVNRIRNTLESLQLALGSTQPLICSTSTKAGHVSIFVPAKERRIIPLESGLRDLPLQTGSLPILAGLRPTNEMLWLDLRETNHLLIAGATGSGKTIYLRGALLTLMVRFEARRLRIHLVDPKQLDFVQFGSAPHLAEPPITSLGDAIDMMGGLLEEVVGRRELLARARCSNIYEFNQAHPGKELPYDLVLIDEYNQLRLSSEPEQSKVLEDRVCQLAQVGRAFGIYLIVATQRPSVEVITGDIKANFPTRMSFRVATGTDSRVILDTDGAERLLGNGDGMVLDSNGVAIRFQALYNDQGSTRTILHAIEQTAASWRRFIPGDPEPADPA
jgi:hypothetical protein